MLATRIDQVLRRTFGSEAAALLLGREGAGGKSLLRDNGSGSESTLQLAKWKQMARVLPSGVIPP